MERQEFEYGRNFAYLKMIDLSSNELTGEIPTAIIRLLELKGLNLSGNRLHGNVPSAIGQLKGLECLDLSTNNFSGFNISTNEGNKGLCGKPLSNNCPGDEAGHHNQPSSGMYEDDSVYERWLYISAVLGFGTTF
ncbi:hypothetical protein POM88_039941 [Heracleum sosnowskyi]|uniref:Uncharacterized protein n=1 Tax=Heracleum sosnowskyi TaxID=360622 RepID=A0AAD8M6W6_9APIA|nr:hypothetical protein POM88_039941 [Heracleum sosnowskyi]